MRCGSLLSPRKNGEKPSHDKLVTAIRKGIAITIAALELGAKNAVAVSMACAVAGIIVGVVGLTGLGLKFSSMMIAFSVATSFWHLFWC